MWRMQKRHWYKGGNAIVSPFGVERFRHREAIPHFVHETRPGSHMLWGWPPNAHPLDFQKQRPPESQAQLLLLQGAGKAGRADVPCCLIRRRAGGGSGRGQHAGPTSQWGWAPVPMPRLQITTKGRAEGGLGLYLPLSPPCLLSGVEVSKLSHLQTSFLGISVNCPPFRNLPNLPFLSQHFQF